MSSSRLEAALQMQELGYTGGKYTRMFTLRHKLRHHYLVPLCWIIYTTNVHYFLSFLFLLSIFSVFKLN